MSYQFLSLPSWAAFKATCVERKNLNIQYVEIGDRYEVYGPDGGLIWHITLLKEDPANADQADFEANVKPVSNWAIPTRPHSFAVPDFRFRGDGVTGTCNAGQTANLDYTMPGDRYINGGMVFVDGSVLGDWVSFSVIDAHEIIPEQMRPMFPDWPLIHSWVQKWYLPRVPVGSVSPMLVLQTPYAGKVIGGLVLRMTINSTGADNVTAAANYLLHEPI